MTRDELIEWCETQAEIGHWGNPSPWAPEFRTIAAMLRADGDLALELIAAHGQAQDAYDNACRKVEAELTRLRALEASVKAAGTTLSRIASIVNDWAESDGKPMDSIPSRTALRSIQRVIAEAALAAPRNDAGRGA